jgi:predicted dehydrogenase/nucleoside-diphosphate-sugar epimerase
MSARPADLHAGAPDLRVTPDSTTTSPVRVAVVGAGFIADFHLSVLAGVEGVTLVAVCDRDRSRAESLAKRYGIPNAVERIDELARLRVTVAHLCTPPDLHVSLANELLESGIGLFVEKPLALASSQARDLAELARARDLPVGVNHNNLHHPAFVRLRDRIAAGEIGRVEHVQVTLSVPLMQLDAGDFGHWMFREPHNIVFEQAVHPLCQVHALIGRVESATTTLLGTRELHPGQVFHDRWAIAAQGERGTAQIYLAFGQGFTRSTLQVIGSDGSLEADLFHNQLAGETKTYWLDFWNSFLAGWRRGGALRADARRVLLHYLKFTLGLGPREDAFYVGMRESIRSFYAALSKGAPLPTDATAAAEVLEWCEATLRGVPNSIPPKFVAPTPRAPRPREVVVLGGTGFLGTRVLAKLHQHGLPATALVRRMHALPPGVQSTAHTGELRLIPGSLEDPASLASALEGVDVVLHLATGGGDTWEKVERAMVQGTIAAAEAALKHRVRRFVYVSSIAALYTGHDCGVREIEDNVELDARPELRPLYSRGKIAAEQALMRLWKERGLPLTIVRPGVVLGAGTPLQHSGFGLWARDNHCIGWGPGDKPLPLVWVDDVADALVALASYEKRDLDGRALNLCARPSLTAAEMVAELRRASNRDLHFHPRGLWLSQLMEIGKWMVKVAGRRPGVEFPSWRDVKARALTVPFTSRTARDVLGWKPVEDRDALLERTVAIYARKR